VQRSAPRRRRHARPTTRQQRASAMMLMQARADAPRHRRRRRHMPADCRHAPLIVVFANILLRRADAAAPRLPRYRHARACVCAANAATRCRAAAHARDARTKTSPPIRFSSLLLFLLSFLHMSAATYIFHYYYIFSSFSSFSALLHTF